MAMGLIILDVSFLPFLVSTQCILYLLFWKQIHYKHLLLMVISMEKSRVLSNFIRGANNFGLNCISPHSVSTSPLVLLNSAR